MQEHSVLGATISTWLLCFDHLLTVEAFTELHSLELQYQGAPCDDALAPGQEVSSHYGFKHWTFTSWLGAHNYYLWQFYLISHIDDVKSVLKFHDYWD